jgi:hypothetical protein
VDLISCFVAGVIVSVERVGADPSALVPSSRHSVGGDYVLSDRCIRHLACTCRICWAVATEAGQKIATGSPKRVFGCPLVEGVAMPSTEKRLHDHLQS